MFEPKIAAQFELDDKGTPKAITKGSNKHYNIQLRVLDAPDDTYAVTYNLHKSYYDPAREVLDKASAFKEELTSYGDYTVTAKVRTKQGVVTVATPLSQALEAGHASGMSAAVAHALEDIKAK